MYEYDCVTEGDDTRQSFIYEYDFVMLTEKRATVLDRTPYLKPRH